MFRSDDFAGVELVEGLSIASVALIDEPIEDLFGKSACGRTRIAQGKLHILISSALDDRERSVTLYHEVLEAVTVAAIRIPALIIDFGEADFEREGYATFDRLGMATPANVLAMLQFYGFGRE